MTDIKDTTLRGVNLLRNPWFNKSSAFTEEERDELGLRGLLPPRVSTFDEQVTRLKGIIDTYEKPINKYIVLEGAHNSDESLYFELLVRYIDQFLPIVYTPTVGQACLQYSHIFRYARGLYVSSEDKGRVRQLVANVPHKDVDIIVVTDGQRILGLGDLGVNGMGIPVGKLALYTACAGVNPQKTLPVCIDVGTNNEELLNDPLYMGLRQKRVTGPEYDALIAEFVDVVRERWPNVVIQFEDFHNSHAYDLLDQYKDKVPCFNDDIQGTASVVLTGMFSSMRILKQQLKDQKVLFLGAGSAATGIAHLIADAMVEEGLTREEALARIKLFDSKGLVTKKRSAPLTSAKMPFAAEDAPAETFLEAIREIQPTAIIGVSAQGGAFTKECLEEMAKINERPIIFALSNPTSKAECTAEEAYTYTDARCLFACGSPFKPIEYKGKTFVPRQGNNHYVFPGIGLGAIFSRAKLIPNEVFLVGAKVLADMVKPEDLERGSLYPALSEVREISAAIGAAVAGYIFDNNLAGIEKPADLKKAVKDAMWDPKHAHFIEE